MEMEKEEERVEKRVDRKGALTEKSKEVAFEATIVLFCCTTDVELVCDVISRIEKS